MGTKRSVTLFGVVSAVVFSLALVERGGRPPLTAGDPTVRAERRTLALTLVEPGTLQAARSITLASEIKSNRAKIVQIAADGSAVRPGDVVVRFDPTPFEEGRAKVLADVRDAEADVARVEQERNLQVAKAQEALETARHAVRLAELSLDSYEKGSGAISVREAEVRAAGSAAELERAEHELRDMQAMFDKGFVSDGELARQHLKVKDLERETGLEKDRLTAAREVTYPRDVERARGQVQEAKDAASRAESVLYYTQAFYVAAQESAERKVDAQREALRAADDELTKVALVAPIEGFVVLQDIPLDNGKRRPQVGDSVWSGVPIATIPDLSQMIALTRVREVDLHRIGEGLDAAVALEAYPDLALNGRVIFIGSLAAAVADSPWKFFDVGLQLDRTEPRLRPGMSVRISFQLDSAKDAVVVPADAIFARGDRSVCYVQRGGETVEQVVAVGKRNETHVQILDGLAAGEEVLLVAPDARVRRQELPEPKA